MPPEPVIADVMDRDVARLGLDEGTAPEARPAAGMRVVVDGAGVPRWVVGRDGPAPAVPVDEATPLARLAELPGLARMLRGGVPGLVVTGGGGVVGTVAASTLVEWVLLDAAYRQDPSGPADAALFGLPEPIRPYVRIRCGTCGTGNEYDSYVPGDAKDCAGGHPLSPEWT